MIKYVNKVLLPKEEIIHQAKVHWSIFIKPTLFLIGAITLYSYDVTFVWLCVLGLSLLYYSRALIYFLATEFVITNKRVIAKVGLISRSTIELNLSNLEGLMVEQSILDRILDAGTLLITGTGGIRTPIPGIDSPYAFREKAFALSESVK